MKFRVKFFRREALLMGYTKEHSDGKMCVCVRGMVINSGKTALHKYQ